MSRELLARFQQLSATFTAAGAEFSGQAELEHDPRGDFVSQSMLYLGEQYDVTLTEGQTRPTLHRWFWQVGGAEQDAPEAQPNCKAVPLPAALARAWKASLRRQQKTAP